MADSAVQDAGRDVTEVGARPWIEQAQTWGFPLDSPGLGASREFNERWRNAMSAWLDATRARTEYAAVLFDAWRGVFEELTREMLGRSRDRLSALHPRALLSTSAPLAARGARGASLGGVQRTRRGTPAERRSDPRRARGAHSLPPPPPPPPPPAGLDHLLADQPVLHGRLAARPLPGVHSLALGSRSVRRRLGLRDAGRPLDDAGRLRHDVYRRLLRGDSRAS